MKRRTKLFLLLTSLLYLGKGSVAQCTIQQNAEKTPSGAFIVLDDPSWQSRIREHEGASGYLWATPNTILYKQKVRDEYRVVQRRIARDGKASPPEILPPLLKEAQEIDSLSPNGKILCLKEDQGDSHWKYTFIRTQGKGKPLSIDSDASRRFWSPDSRYAYGTQNTHPLPILERFDTQTGDATETTLNAEHDLNLSYITAKGELLCLAKSLPPLAEHTFFFTGQGHGSKTFDWQMSRIEKNTVVTTTYKKRFIFDYATFCLSPDGKRILWSVKDEAIRWAGWSLHRSLSKPKNLPEIIRWLITDIEGNNESWIGITQNYGHQGMLQSLQWTPGGKGVHFIDGGVRHEVA